MPEAEVITQIIDPAQLQAQKEIAISCLKEIGDLIDAINNKAQGAKGLMDITAALKGLKDIEDQAVVIAKQLENAEKGLAFARTEEGKARLAQLATAREERAQLNDEVKLRNAAADSMARQRVEAKNLTKEIENMSKAEKDSAKGMDMQRHLESLNDGIRNFGVATGKMQANVGNYPQMFKSVGAAAGMANNAMGGLNSTFSQAQTIWSELKQNGTGFQKVIGGLFIGAGVLAGGFMALSGTFEFFKSVMESTQGSADQWKVAVAGMKGGYDAFKASLASDDGWSEMFHNISTGISAARDFQEAMNTVAEQRLALTRMDVQTQKEYDELIQKSHNKEFYSLTQRGEFLAQAVEVAHKYYDQVVTTDIYEKETNAKKLDDQTKLGKATVERMAMDAINNKREQADAKEIIRLQDVMKREKPKRGEDESAQYTAASSALTGYNAKQIEYAKTFRQYLKGDPTLIKDFIASLNKVDADRTALTEKTTSTMSRFWRESASANTTATSKAQSEDEAAQRKHEELLKHRVEVEKAAQTLLSKYGIGGLSNQSAIELKEVVDTEAFKTLTIEEQEKVRLAIKAKYIKLASDAYEKSVMDELKAMRDADKIKEEHKKAIDAVLNKWHVKSLDEQQQDEVDAVYQMEASESEQDKMLLAIYGHYLQIKQGYRDDATHKDFEKEKEATAAKKQLETTLINGTSGVINEIGNIFEESYRQDLEKYKSVNESEKNVLKDRLDHGLISKATYDSKIQVLDNDMAAKQRETQKKQADTAMSMALVTTAANLAISLSSAISGASTAAAAGGPAAPILEILYIAEMVLAVVGAFAGVYSAIQKGQSASFEKGTKNAPEGFATVHPGEGIWSGGRMRMTSDNGPSLAFLHQGDWVIPKPDMQAITASGLANSDYRSNVAMDSGLREDIRDLQNGFFYLGSIIENKPETQFIASGGELTKIVKAGNSRYEYHLRNTP